MSREKIFEALSQSALGQLPMPEINLGTQQACAVETFIASAEKAAAKVVRLQDTQALVERIEQAKAKGMQVLCLAQGFEGNRDQANGAHSLENIDLTLVEAPLGVAENGAILLTDAQMGAHRVTPYITEELAVILRTEQIVATMHQAIEQLQLDQIEHGVFIAGPSKTADIEQALVIGAHGARAVTLYLID
ncbi:LutC/YkgG family protein [Paraferrimonas sedimenticola]|uniref:Lactate dehydrogenase n=1 Tax=Paraferrimonas sedimenticola TaxID=375674 RepID=A0AA37RXB9_9GAMM|nr:LUD domain-containing protein [Paraferrimonas sedimenticola]GLP97114.1 lactate dehydrogenase [Paraferrimonas sedimenticola]